MGPSLGLEKGREEMTVAELIERLEQFPPGAPVVCFDGGHDGDYTEPSPQLVQGKVWDWGWEPARGDTDGSMGVQL